MVVHIVLEIDSHCVIIIKSFMIYFRWEADAPQTYREQPVYVNPFTWYLTTAVTAVITFYVGYHFYNHFDHVSVSLIKSVVLTL